VNSELLTGRKQPTCPPAAIGDHIIRHVFYRPSTGP